MINGEIYRITFEAKYLGEDSQGYHYMISSNRRVTTLIHPTVVQSSEWIPSDKDISLLEEERHRAAQVL